MKACPAASCGASSLPVLLVSAPTGWREDAEEDDEPVRPAYAAVDTSHTERQAGRPCETGGSKRERAREGAEYRMRWMRELVTNLGRRQC